MVNGLPAYVKTTQNEWHINDLDYTSDTLVQKAYSDGFGRVIQTRAQAEEVIFGDQDFGDSGLPASQAAANANAVGVENTSTTAINVIVNGFKTTNNKGAVIEQWEPFYSTGWDYQPATVSGVLPSYYGQKVVMYYDSIGRAVRTVNPDGTEQRVVTGVPINTNLSPAPFAPTPWESYTYDANDLADITHNGQTHNVPNGHFLTPRSVKIDALGRMIESTDRNYNGGLELVVMKYFYDIRGNKLRVDDAIKVDVNTSRNSAFLHVYDLANQPLKTTHIDKGVSTVVINAAGLPIEMHDAKGALVLSSYDELLRPVSMWARDNGSEDVTLRQYVLYGENHSNAVAENFMGRPWKQYDEAGMVEMLAYDYKGQPKSKSRQVIKDGLVVGAMPTIYRVDWIPGGTGQECTNEGALLEGNYVTDIEYDALGRPTSITLPADVSTGRKIVEPTYNRAGAMESISLDSTVYVSRLAYNAKGQKILVTYGNGLMTRFAYDPVNFRLLRQKTEGFSLSSLTYTPSSGTTKYDSAYEYDLAGSIVHITDATPSCGVGGSGGSSPDELIRDFEYDALYRLIRATGRASGAYGNVSDPWNESYSVPDLSDTGTTSYIRTYKYDKLGNLLDLYHYVSISNNFHRYFNDFDSAPTAAFASSNLATKIKYGSTTLNYTFDANGNMVSEGASRSFEWDYGDRMRGFAEGSSVQAAYLYDGGGNRVKKIVVDGSGNSVVTVYIDGGFEHLYKLSSAAVISEAHNELHVMDGRSRIAVKRVGTAFSGDSSPAVRYNLEDHLGNSSVTVDSSGSLISREEYFPFGETSFGSYSKKRYRFCGKERDEESGLYYYGARYYAAWSCRFVSVDPLAGKYPFYTPYQYAGNQPINAIDVDGLEPDPKNTPSTQKAENDGGNGDYGIFPQDWTGPRAIDVDLNKPVGTQLPGKELSPQEHSPYQQERFNNIARAKINYDKNLEQLQRMHPVSYGQPGEKSITGFVGNFYVGAEEVPYIVVPLLVIPKLARAAGALKKAFAFREAAKAGSRLGMGIQEAEAAVQASKGATEASVVAEGAASAGEAAGSGGKAEELASKLLPYEGKGGGHHVGAKAAFDGLVGFDSDKMLALRNHIMEAWGIRHADVTGAQQRLYRQFVKTGAPFTWEAMAKIETQAIVHGSGYSLNFETVKPTVDAALHHIRTTMGVAQPFRIPWGGL